VLGVGLGTAFAVFGVAKLFGSAAQLEDFERWGFPTWVVYVIGLVELTGGLALLGRTTAPYAASLLVGTMMGAVGTHLSHGEVSRVALPVVLSLLLVMYGWLRRPDFLRRVDPERLTPSNHHV
jgi:uncharacterized membrane protein YphA (DoxX/SURF4 family)